MPCSFFLTAGLERCAGEVIADMLDIVENYDPDEAQMQLVMRGDHIPLLLYIATPLPFSSSLIVLKWLLSLHWGF